MLNYIPAPRNIGKHVLLNKEVRGGQVKMQSHGICHWAERIVRRHSHVVDLSHGRDFPGLHEASAVAEVWLNDVARLLLENLAKLVAGHEPLAGGDRHSDRPS